MMLVRDLGKRKANKHSNERYGNIKMNFNIAQPTRTGSIQGY